VHVQISKCIKSNQTNHPNLFLLQRKRKKKEKPSEIITSDRAKIAKIIYIRPCPGMPAFLRVCGVGAQPGRCCCRNTFLIFLKVFSGILFHDLNSIFSRNISNKNVPKPWTEKQKPKKSDLKDTSKTSLLVFRVSSSPSSRQFLVVLKDMYLWTKQQNV
jgi:hypothetical protein